MTGFSTKLPPAAFYSCTHPSRWFDEFSHPEGDDKLILTPEQLKDKYERDSHYATWCRRRNLPPRKMKWQAMRILTMDHADRNVARDWWDLYRDCVFRVFLQPYTMRDPGTNEYRQWYILCPEDSEMVLRWECEKHGLIQPPRRASHGERWISTNKNINKALCVPVECCHQLRHETTAGHLPAGL